MVQFIRITKVVRPAGVGLLMAMLVALAAWYGLGSNGFVENGPVERLTMLTYLASGVGIAAVLTLHGDWLASRLNAAIAASLLIVLAAREGDLHKTELLGSLTRTATYVDGSRPISLRIVAACIVIAVVAIGVAFAWRTLRPLVLRREWPGDPVTVGALLAAAMLAFAKLLDGAPRKLTDLSVLAPDWFVSGALYTEETLEAAAALTFYACLLEFAFTRSTARASDPKARLEAA